MSKNQFNFAKAALYINIFLIQISICKFTQVSELQGEDAILIFPYPCNSTEVTLQQNNGAPFYRSRHGLSLFLPQDQVHRFKVQNKTENGNCFLDLTISDLMRNDRGMYILFVFKSGEILDDGTQKIVLVVDYPPGKASCVVCDDRGEDQVSIDCTASAGSLPGEIKCYQNGELMPPLTNPTIVDEILKETIGIKKSQPAFCCSSLLIEYKERCDCNDTGLYLSDDGNIDPCPDPSKMTTMHHLPFSMENDESHHNFTVTSSIPIIKENKTKQVIITTSIIFTIGVSLIILYFGYMPYKMKIKNRTNNGRGNLHKSLYNL